MKLLCCWIMLLVSVAGCSRDQHDHPDLTTGQDLYNYHCEECHGRSGTGKLFDGIPANILSDLSTEEIVDYIRIGGGRKREMPVFQTMPFEEAKRISAYLHTLRQRYSEEGGTQLKQLLIKP